MDGENENDRPKADQPVAEKIISDEILAEDLDEELNLDDLPL